MVVSGSAYGVGGQLTLHLTGFIPPANDNISHATIVTSLPFTDQVDTTAASAAAGDPSPCNSQAGATVWYKFVAPATGLVRLDASGSNYGVVVAAYTGSPGALTQVACGEPATNPFAVTKGVTYYFVASGAFGNGGSLQFRVTALSDIPAISRCDVVLTGTIQNGVTVRSGTTCLISATVNGGVSVRPGGQLLTLVATIHGSLTTDGAGALAICASSVSGSVTVRASTGLVIIGDGGDGSGRCPGNMIGSSVGIVGNTSGVEFGGNTVNGVVAITGNKPNASTVLTADDASIEIEANHIGAGLNCTRNGSGTGQRRTRQYGVGHPLRAMRGPLKRLNPACRRATSCHRRQ
jgi:hypothetical protein